MTKQEIREINFKKRNSLSAEYCINADKSIFDKLILSDEYQNSDLVLVYVSAGSEINTENIISYSFRVGKRIAVPHCRNGIMDFYEIKSIDELTNKQFGILTVDISDRNPVSITDKTLCIVPALCVDKSGNRIGYGGGYYDRFLKANDIIHICLVRKDFVIENIPAEDYDYKIKKFLTDI